MKNERTLEVDLKPSRWQIALCVLAASAALTGIFLTSLALTIQLAFSLTVIVSLAYQLNELLGSRQRIRKITYLGGEWWLTFSKGRTIRVRLVGVRVVLPLVIAVNFTMQGRGITCTIPLDSVSPTEHRRLRVAFLNHPYEQSFANRLWQLAIAWWDQYRVRWVRRFHGIVQRVM